jgi:hypothetical protein
MDSETSPQHTFSEGSVSQRIIEPLHLYDPPSIKVYRIVIAAIVALSIIR